MAGIGLPRIRLHVSWSAQRSTFGAPATAQPAPVGAACTRCSRATPAEADGLQCAGCVLQALLVHSGRLRLPNVNSKSTLQSPGVPKPHVFNLSCGTHGGSSLLWFAPSLCSTSPASRAACAFDTERDAVRITGAALKQLNQQLSCPEERCSSEDCMVVRVVACSSKHLHNQSLNQTQSNATAFTAQCA